MKDFNDRARPPPAPSSKAATQNHQKELVKMITDLSYRHSQWQVFADFVEMAAISVSNAVDFTQREPREARYMEVIKRYKPDEIAQFPLMMSKLVLALEDEPDDVLGRTFHDLELHNKWSGQYFTPYPLCRMMAKMTLSDDIEARIAERGFVTVQEPAAGSGAMVIAVAHEMLDAKISYQQHLHVTAVDVDPKCVHMAFLQFSLLHIPATIIHGNSLSLEEYGHWYTPAHIMDGWRWKLRRAPAGQHEIDRPAILPPSLLSNAEPSPEEGKPPLPGPSQLTLF
jgi:type I restriction-modification system DNA methylase subunit